MLQNHEDCLALLVEKILWGEKPRCPYCDSLNATSYKNERRYRCNECFTSYIATVGTFFHKTHVELHKWFIAIHLVLNSSGGISVRQLAKEIGVNKNTASYMIVRIRKAMLEESELLCRILESYKL